MENLSELELKRVRLGLYPSIFEKNKDDKYRVDVYIDKTTHVKEIEELKRKIDFSLKEKNLTRDKIEKNYMCFKDFSLHNNKVFENSYKLTCKSAFPLDIVSADLRKLTTNENEMFYPGCFVNICFSLYSYSARPKDSSIVVKGISASLHGLQFAGRGDVLQAYSNDCAGIFSAINIDDEGDIADLENEF